MRIAKNGFFQAAVPLTFLATSFSVWADNLTAHKDNYFLPYYQESRVNQARFEALNPNQTSVNDTFVQFQFSAKYRVLSLKTTGCISPIPSVLTGKPTQARPIFATAPTTPKCSTASFWKKIGRLT